MTPSLPNCLRCGKVVSKWSMEMIGGDLGRFSYLCQIDGDSEKEGCGFSWRVGALYMVYRKWDIWWEVPYGCLAIFNSEEML